MESKARDMDPAVPTLEDVATRAGVSTATVSRCLNSPERVSKSTRERVTAAVDALGYTPNFGARALAAKRTNIFGAIIPTMENAIFARGLQAFEDELARNGITLLVASSSYNPDLEEEQIRTLVARGADALLLVGQDRSPEIYSFLENRRIPYVVTWSVGAESGPASVGFDNRKAMSALAREILRLGHRDLAMITAPRAGNDRARERWEGVVNAMKAGGLNPEDLRLIETPYSIASGAQAFEALMAAPQPPTAILCGNDVLAAGALMMAAKLGINVPGDVSITGFDDIDIAEIVTPSLTTIHVPHRKMGMRAAQALLALRNQESHTKRIELEADIKWRNSLGPRPM